MPRHLRFSIFWFLNLTLIFMLGCQTTPTAPPPAADPTVSEAPVTNDEFRTNDGRIARRDPKKKRSTTRAKTPKKSVKDSAKSSEKNKTTPTPVTEETDVDEPDVIEPVITPTPAPVSTPTVRSTPESSEGLPTENLEDPPTTIDPLPPDNSPDLPLESPEDLDSASVIPLNHPPLSLIYSKSHKLAVLVQYELTEQQLKSRFIDRDKNPFAADPELLSIQPSLAIGKKSYGKPYDRGHLAPAEDISWDEDGFFASFYMSNMAPQKDSLNQRSWKNLEDDVREWACGEKKVTILTGPIFALKPEFTKGKVEIPEAFFKVVVDETPPRKAAAFIYEQDAPGKTKPFERQVTLASLSHRLKMKFSTRIQAYRELDPLKVTDLQTWKSIKCPEAKNRVKDFELLKDRDARKRRLGREQE